jgi:hypothetical protein
LAAIADITVKKADGTTDIIWSAVTGSGVDGTAALWRNNASAGFVGQRPTYTLTSRSNQAGTVRRLDGVITFPSVYTETSTSLTKEVGVMSIKFSVAVPQNLPNADIREFAAQATHVINDGMTYNAILTGYSPR